MAFDISNYTTVQERVALFYEKYPEGSIQFQFMGVMDGDPTKMWGIARAYRSPEDLLPGGRHLSLLLARVHTHWDQSCRT